MSEIEDLDGEIWAAVCGFEGLYQVSNFCRVKSLGRFVKYGETSRKYLKEKVIKLITDTRGYYNINFYKNGKIKHFHVHRLVAQAFLPANFENKRTINHKDGNKINNVPSNLEWATDLENVTHALETGLSKVKGEYSGMAKLTNEDIFKIRELYNNKAHYKEIAIIFNINTRTVYKIINKERWGHI